MSCSLKDKLLIDEDDEEICFKTSNFKEWVNPAPKKESISIAENLYNIEKFDLNNYKDIIGKLNKSANQLKNISNISIKPLKNVYNMNESIRKSGVDMNRNDDSFTYIKKCTEGLEKYIEISEKNDEILAIDLSYKTKVSNILRDLSNEIKENKILINISKDTVMASLEFCARLMSILQKKYDFKQVPKESIKEKMDFIDRLSNLLTEEEADKLDKYINNKELKQFKEDK